MLVAIFFLRGPMALNIKDPKPTRWPPPRDLTGEKITDAVKTAVRERLDRERGAEPDWLELKQIMPRPITHSRSSIRARRRDALRRERPAT